MSEHTGHTVAGAGATTVVSRLLELTDLTKSYGGVTAVNRVSMFVDEATITGLIGPNGAGKSTVLSLIAGTERPTSGSIALAGNTISGLPSHQIARLGVVRTFQTASVFGHMTVLENLVFGFYPQHGENPWRALFGRRAWRRQETDFAAQGREVLARFALGDLEDAYGEELSGGQRRIVEILRALMAHPRLLLLDEPMAGVHPAMRLRIEELLQEVQSLGTTILMVEHELDVLERVADSVIVMTQGNVMLRGTMHEIRQNKDVQRAYLTG